MNSDTEINLVYGVEMLARELVRISRSLVPQSKEWTGTKEDFYKAITTFETHMKNCFPELPVTVKVYGQLDGDLESHLVYGAGLYTYNPLRTWTFELMDHDNLAFTYGNCWTKYEDPSGSNIINIINRLFAVSTHEPTFYITSTSHSEREMVDEFKLEYSDSDITDTPDSSDRYL